MPSATSTSPVARSDVESFASYLKSSQRILALCGAGLSAASGLPTFRGVGGYWRNYDATRLATPQAWDADPGLVWQFYNYRRHMALKAQPNAAHLALAELARRNPHFLTISQNVDGLSQRAGHPLQTIEFLHGSLFDVKCDGFSCGYVDRNNFTDPIAPALAVPSENGAELDISRADIPLTSVPAAELPQCPKCGSLIRPGVVWFGESLPRLTLERVDEFMSHRQGVDLIIVIGTSAKVYPAAGYITQARKEGARVAVVNTEEPDEVASRLQPGDWFFKGDAGVVLPKILESVIGSIPTEEQRSQGLM